MHSQIDELERRLKTCNNQSEFCFILDELSKSMRGADLLEAYFPMLLRKDNLDVFAYAFFPMYNNIFSKAIITHIPLVIRYIVKREDEALLTKFARNYKDELAANIDLLFTRNSKRDQFVSRLIFMFGTECFYWCKDAILKYSTIPTTNYDSISKRLINLMMLLDNLDDKYFIKNIKSISNALEKTITMAIKLGVIYGPDKNVYMINKWIQIAHRHENILKILERYPEFLISLFTMTSVKNLKREKLLNFFIALIHEIEIEQKITIGDITATGGSTSTVLIMGDRVIKIQMTEIEPLPYDPCLLRPLVRTTLHDLEGNPLYGLEIFDRVKTIGLNEEKIYEMFKSAIKRGILLADCRLLNTGILLRKNLPYLKDAAKIDKFGNPCGPYDVDDRDIEIVRENETYVTLDKGSYIHTDLEDIHKKDRIDIDRMIEERMTCYDYVEITSRIYSFLCGDLKWELTIYPLLERYVKEYLEERLDKKCQMLKPINSKNPI
ncbi:MAG TPA: hypothetical protein DCY94_05390 [Firmicutes bacterium]|nr:hypothetical protein [Bacillota bacterium]